jgi:hypothetical protein
MAKKVKKPASKSSDQIAGEKNVGHRFKKGDPRPKSSGRKPGQANRISIALKDAVIAAAEHAGQKYFNKRTGEFDRPGTGGLLGFCTHLALHREDLFTPLLAKVMPFHILPSVVNKNVYRTEEDIRLMCEEAGIDFESMRSLSVEVPRHMIDVTPAIEDKSKANGKATG